MAPVAPVVISVVMPVLDEADAIAVRLSELRAMGLTDVVVVDGGSTDGTVARATGRATVLRAPRGRASQMNAGAAAARGDVLLFLHADVRLPRDAPARIRAALADPRVEAGAFKTWTVADRPHPLAPLLHLADVRSRVTRHPYGDQALFVRADVFREVGGFPELALMEDLALSRRLARRRRIARVDARVEVSGRRFLARPLRTMLAWNTFPTLYRLGVSTETLARWYGRGR